MTGMYMYRVTRLSWIPVSLMSLAERSRLGQPLLSYPK